ncbi:MAG: winged helix-turn-helix transcriptional regulator, partial [Deltaproteobacteria bacterium]|nr:winged helix-turn-helix transcriptional regulator [Deltaproteobacteria bacterium]
VEEENIHFTLKLSFRGQKEVDVKALEENSKKILKDLKSLILNEPGKRNLKGNVVQQFRDYPEMVLHVLDTNDTVVEVEWDLDENCIKFLSVINGKEVFGALWDESLPRKTGSDVKGLRKLKDTSSFDQLQVEIINLLANYGTEMPVTEVLEMMESLSSKTTAHRRIADLIEKGWIKKRIEGKKHFLSLTQKAEAMIEIIPLPKQESLPPAPPQEKPSELPAAPKTEKPEDEPTLQAVEEPSEVIPRLTIPPSPRSSEPPQVTSTSEVVQLKPRSGERTGLLGMGEAFQLFSKPVEKVSGRHEFEITLVLPNLHRWAFKIQTDSKGRILSERVAGQATRYHSSRHYPLRIERTENYQQRLKVFWDESQAPLVLDLHPIEERGALQRLELAQNQPDYTDNRHFFFREEAPQPRPLTVLHSEIVSFNTLKNQDGMQSRMRFYLNQGDFIEIQLNSFHHGKGSYEITSAEWYRLGLNSDEGRSLEVSGSEGNGGINTLAIRDVEKGLSLKLTLNFPHSSVKSFPQLLKTHIETIPHPIWIRAELPESERPINKRNTSSEPSELPPEEVRQQSSDPLTEEDTHSTIQELKRGVYKGELSSINSLAILALEDPKAFLALEEIYERSIDPRKTEVDFGGISPNEIRRRTLREITSLAAENDAAWNYLLAADEL